MANKKQNIKGLLFMVFVSIGLCSCGTSSSSPVQNAVIEASNQISAYHTTAFVEHLHEGSNPNQNEIIANTTVTQNGGDGTRIDKVNGMTTNHIEVFAKDNQAVFRYYQEKWEETLTPDATLRNVLIFPYQTMNNLLASVTNLLKWEKNIEGKWVATYDGDRPEVSNAIAVALNIQTVEGSKSSIKIIISDTSKQIEKVEFKLIQTISDQEKNTYRAVITYDGINQQFTKPLPNETGEHHAYNLIRSI